MRVPAFAALLAASGCSLFSDFGGFSEPPAEASGADGGDAAVGDGGGGGGSDGAAEADGAPVNAYREAVLADTPASYWPLDDPPTANVVRDVVGGHDAEIVGTVTLGAAGVAGTGLLVPSIDVRLEVGDHHDIVGRSAYALEYWAKPTLENEYQSVFYKRDDDTMHGWVTYFKKGQGGAGTVQIDHRYPDGSRTAWLDIPTFEDRYHHVVFTFDPDAATAKMRLYVDSKRIDGYDDGKESVATTATLLIAHTYVGLLDELAIYDHTLSAERVLAHYELGKK